MTAVGRVDFRVVILELVDRMMRLLNVVVVARGIVNPTGVVRDTDLLGVSSKAELKLTVFAFDDVDVELLSYIDDSLV